MDPADAELIELIRTTPDELLDRVVASLSDAEVALLEQHWASMGREQKAIPASPAEQAQELSSEYRIVPHLAYLSERLAAAVNDVERGIERKLLVSMPPRHGKTEMTSVYLPVWLLRRNPQTKIGIISHSPTLATMWGRRVRRMVERYGDSIGLSIAPDAGAVGEWETPEGGSVMSRSIGQALAGVGFNVLIIDDPTRDFAAAHSKDQRQSVWSWWTANAITRLEPPSLVIVIQTRWHEDDLTGRLLSTEHEGDPTEWEQIIIPAIASHDPKKGETDVLGREPGEPLLSPLVPNETPEQALTRFDKLRRSVGSYAWAALYQQSPSPAKGAIFSTEWWRFWSTDPAHVAGDGKTILLDRDRLRDGRLIDSWDATFKGTDSSDYVVGQRWARCAADFFLLEQSRARRSFTETLEEQRAFFGRGIGAELTRQHLVEDKANGPAIMDVLRREVPGLKPVEPRGTKEARARAITPPIESGNVFLPDPRMPGFEWVRELMDEARTFPNGEHDDQVDAMSQALDHLLEASPVVVHMPNAVAAAQARRGPASFRAALGGR